MTYKVRTPSGVRADGEWDSLSDIPTRIPDRFEHYFETAEADIEKIGDNGEVIGFVTWEEKEAVKRPDWEMRWNAK